MVFDNKSDKVAEIIINPRKVRLFVEAGEKSYFKYDESDSIIKIGKDTFHIKNSEIKGNRFFGNHTVTKENGNIIITDKTPLGISSYTLFASFLLITAYFTKKII